MKPRLRKRRNQFEADPPSCQFGMVRGVSPMDKPNPLCRSIYRETSPGTPAVIKQEPYIRERFLRWFTPELYRKNNGFYFHKKDKRYYKVIDTFSRNPYRRYKFVKTFYREKRYYSTESRNDIKPYTLRVIDLVSPGYAVVGSMSESEDLSWLVTDSSIPKLAEAFRSILSLADLVDPLVERGNYSYWGTFGEGDEIITRCFYPRSKVESGEYRSLDPYFYESRVAAFEAASNGSLTIAHGDKSYYDPIPYEAIPSRPVYVYSSQFLYHCGDKDFDLETLRSVNDRLLALGLKPVESYNPQDLPRVYGITGPDFIETELCDSVPLWSRFMSFDYDRDSKASLSSRIDFLDLTGLCGFNSFSKQPLRSSHLGQFLGEMPETVKSFADVLSSAITVCKRLKKGDFKGALRAVEIGKKYLSKGKVDVIDVAQAASSLDLFWKFGLKPFLDDLEAIADMGKTFGDVTFNIGSKRRIRHDWSKMPWKDRSVDVEIDSEFFASVDRLPASCRSNIRASLTMDIEYGAKVRVRDPFAFFFEATGLNSILGTAWELVPLSFVIDWFVDVGSLINRSTDIKLDSFDIVDGYVTYCVNGTVTETLTDIKIGHDFYDSIVNQYKVFETSRGFFDPRLSISIDGNDAKDFSLDEQLALLDLVRPERDVLLSPSKLGTLAELIVQRIRS